MARIKLRTLELTIATIDGTRRMVYEQLDGTVIMGSECKCYSDPFACPIDKHALKARQQDFDATERT